VQPLNIDFVLLIKEELKFDKSTDIIELHPWNIFSQLSKVFIHINKIVFFPSFGNLTELTS